MAATTTTVNEAPVHDVPPLPVTMSVWTIRHLERGRTGGRDAR